MDKHFIQARRKALAMSQGQVAELLGVTRIVYGRWERGERATPRRHRARLAEVLQIEDRSLDSHARRGTLPACVEDTRHRVRRPYPTSATVDQVLRLGGQACAMVRGAREELDEREVQAILDGFARDTKHELLLVLTLMAFGAQPIWTSPLRFDCPVLILDDFRSEYGGDLMQWALLWEWDGEIIVVFGQQRVKSVFVKSRARVDFLVYHKAPGRRAQWMIVELDGREHATQEAQDDERAENLLIPEIRYDNQKLMSDHWFHRFQEDVRRASVEGARRETERNRKSDEFRRLREEEVRRRAEQM